MKLNNQSKNELRSKIVTYLSEVPSGQKIKLDGELLDSLLFETITINKEKGIQVKLPVWSGSFLRKIDLSQVDFEDVSWSALDLYPYFDPFANVEPDSNAREQINRTVKNVVIMDAEGYPVDYSWTNANIDLTKSFEAKHNKQVVFVGCSFNGVDFSETDLSRFESIILKKSSIYATRLVIPSKVNLKAEDSDFTDIDLSSRTIDACDNLCYSLSKSLPGCILYNTGININLKSEDFEDAEMKRRLGNTMTYKWEGCYVNGVKVKEAVEISESLKKLKDEYQRMKDAIIISTINSIEEQIEAMQKK